MWKKLFYRHTYTFCVLEKRKFPLNIRIDDAAKKRIRRKKKFIHLFRRWMKPKPCESICESRDELTTSEINPRGCYERSIIFIISTEKKSCLFMNEMLSGKKSIKSRIKLLFYNLKWTMNYSMTIPFFLIILLWHCEFIHRKIFLTFSIASSWMKKDSIQFISLV